MHDASNETIEELAAQLKELLMAKKRKADEAFWEGLDEGSLRARFDTSNETVFHTVKPIWDLRPESLKFNDVVPQALTGAKLYVANRDLFVQRCTDARIYCHAAFMEYSDLRHILRVVGHWIGGKALTPPLFFFDSDGSLEKVDGHHRTTVALMTTTRLFPFYCQDRVDIEGIVLASAELIRENWWQPDSA